MKERADPSSPAYRPPDDAEERRAEYHTGNGRRPSLKIPTYKTLADLGVQVAGKTIELASLPLDPGTLALDTRRIEAELLRTGKHAPSLSTIAVSEATACVMYDIAINEAGLTDFVSGGCIRTAAANMPLLVGHLMPVFGQARAEATSAHKKPKSQRDMAAIEPLGEGGALPRKPHSFAMQPVQLSTVGTADQGQFLCGGVIVSNKCFNYPEGDDKRVSTGRNPAFEETVCWMLVTHAYFLSYAQLGPPSTKSRRDGTVAILDSDSRNTHEHLFGWRLFMEQNLDSRRGNVSSFGFTDIKQTGRDTTRRILPWSILDVSGRLATMRAEVGAQLVEYLRDLPMRAALNHESDLAHRAVGGMDLRRMLLLELLLRGTPLEGLLTEGQALALAPLAPLVPGGAQGLYDRMKAFCDAMY